MEPSARDAVSERPLGHFGVHLMLDGYGGATSALADREIVHTWLQRTPDALGMRRLSEPFLMDVEPQSEKDPGGLSGFVLIAESHLSVHTFPDRGFVSADVYTCQPDLDTQPICDGLKASFGLSELESQLVLRGTRYAETHPDAMPRREQAGTTAGAPAEEAG